MRSEASRIHEHSKAVMNLLVLFIPFFQFIPSKGTTQITKFAGQTVTLPAGVNRTLRQVYWSIFLNTTYIASYQNDQVTIDWLPQYSGRLSLNTTTGDLTIRNLKKQDARVYKVVFHISEIITENLIELIVNEALLPPNITLVSSQPNCERRWLVLNCVSKTKGVNYTWQVNPLMVKISEFKSPGKIHSEYNITRGLANFTCTTTRGSESTSSLYQDHCERKTSPASTQRERPVHYFIAFLSGCAVTAICMFCILRNRNKYHQHAADVSS